MVEALPQTIETGNNTISMNNAVPDDTSSCASESSNYSGQDNDG